MSKKFYPRGGGHGSKDSQTPSPHWKNGHFPRKGICGPSPCIKNIQKKYLPILDNKANFTPQKNYI